MPSRNLDYAQISEDIPKWIDEKSSQRWLVIWVSGGVDSAVVSTLGAMSWKALTALELPIHQKRDEVDRAKEHIQWLQDRYANVSSQIIDLSEVYEQMRSLQYPWDNPESEYLADVNLRSRLRATQLYATANRKNALVLGTGNKVEDYGIGFFTKFGDGAVDISPIGDLYKSEVRALAHELWVPETISEAVATDGLHSNGATDEDQIWASYDELEWAMVKYDAWKRASDFSWRAQEVMGIYTARHEWNAHKMQMPPIFDIEA